MPSLSVSAVELRSSFGNLVADVYDRIYTQLTTLAVEPGQRLSVDALAREFGVSQTPVRSALSRLESDGLVVKQHNRGYRVTPALSAEEFDQLFDVRILLETYAASHAAIRRTAEHLVELDRLDTAMANCHRDGGLKSGYADFTILDRSLHDVVAAACGNPLVQEALQRLHAHLHVYRARRGAVEEAIDEHRLIVSAIRSRDPDLAAGAMRSHLNHGRARALGDWSAVRSVRARDGADLPFSDHMR